MTNTIRLQDVADLAGVSIGTASQALNHRPGVAPDTRVRVMDAARTLGYPIPQDTGESSRTIDVIGMLTKHDFGFAPGISPFYVHVQAGVENECRRHNISLMFANIEVDNSNHPLSWPAMLSEERIQGLLLVGTFIDDTVESLRQRLDLPIVLIDGYAPTMPFDSVIIDNDLGTRTAMDYLIKNGHEHIGLVGTNPKSPLSVLERRNSYFEVMHEHGLPTHYVQDSQLTQEAGYSASLELLQRAPEVTAIFGAADIVAIGALNAVRDLGLSVPDDVSIIGFDDIDMAGFVTPALTTVHVHKTWMGALGVRQLVHRASQPHQPKVEVVVSTELTLRDSVGPCRHGSHVCGLSQGTLVPQHEKGRLI